MLARPEETGGGLVPGHVRLSSKGKLMPVENVLGKPGKDWIAIV